MEGLPSDHPDLNQSGQPSAALRAVRAPVRATDSEGARAIAAVLVEGFDRHYRLFRATSADAKEHFEAAAWIAAQTAVRERIQFYDERVAECIARVRAEFDLESVGLDTWKEAKLAYISLLVDHLQPELAETFYNSVVTRLLGCAYSDNELIFARGAISTEYVDSDPPIYRSYYPGDGGLGPSFEQIFVDFGWSRPFADLGGDVRQVLRALADHAGAALEHLEPNHQVQVLSSAFYRNKAAYVVGKVINGYRELPFVVPVLNDGRELSLDTIVLDEEQLNVIFSLSRAYCMVDMAVPAGYVRFLRRMMPTKTRSDLYTMLGLGKQGKTLFYRDLRQHLRHSRDLFVPAPGFAGKVMLVFTLPSYPYVFKVIKDVFGHGKDTDRATVEAKFAMAKHVDRVGRMADTIEFTDLELPGDRFSEALLDQLRTLAPSMVDHGEALVIRHCYVERRMIPLNIYLDRGAPAAVDAAVEDYGNAIRDLAIANIFPGDMLWRNFGVTRHERVVFYDYDEIEYLTDVSFRPIPEPPTLEAELAAEPWYSVGQWDVFPEEFEAFLLADPRLREPFLRAHADLLEPEFWQDCQRRIGAGEVVDFFPYPQSMRFCNRRVG